MNKNYTFEGQHNNNNKWEMIAHKTLIVQTLKTKSRRITTDALEYLKQKAAKETILKEQELRLAKKKEQEGMMESEKERNQHKKNLTVTMVKQQQMMMMVNQQQQQSQTLLAFMEKFVPILVFPSLYDKHS